MSAEVRTLVIMARKTPQTSRWKSAGLLNQQTDFTSGLTTGSVVAVFLVGATSLSLATDRDDFQSFAVTGVLTIVEAHGSG